MSCGSHLALDVALAQLVGGERGGGGGTHAEAVACRAWGRLAGRGAQHVVTLKSKPCTYNVQLIFMHDYTVTGQIDKSLLLT